MVFILYGDNLKMRQDHKIIQVKHKIRAYAECIKTRS